MAHFAQLNEDNEVVRVLVVDNDVILDDNLVEQETLGIQYLQQIFGSNTSWVQTSYNSNFRGTFAGIGFIYDAAQDVFKPKITAPQ